MPPMRQHRMRPPSNSKPNTPPPDQEGDFSLKKIADALHVTVSYLTDENETDPGKAFEEEAYIREAEDVYGPKAGREAQELLSRARALFAGGDLDEEAKEIFMQSLFEEYLDSKNQARAKFTPKTKRKGMPSLR